MKALKTLVSTWDRYGKSAIGRKLISRALGFFIPYTGSIDPEIIQLQAGHCKVLMRDKKKLRNHLRSLHAIALVNLGEVTSGLALNLHLVEKARAIVTSLTIDYLKKARGSIMAEAQVACPPLDQESQQIVTTHLYDQENTKVAEVRVTWLIRPR